MARIYLDYHATTPCDARVVEAMMPFFTQKFGNAASRTHSFGKEAARAVETAREQIAALIHADPSEIVFTSGATESNNLAIKGVLGLPKPRGNHVVTVATEHPSVLDPCRALEREGRARLTVLPVNPDGRVDLKALKSALTGETALVSVMFANNEIGVLQPLAEIAALAHARGSLLHVDAAQAAGKVPIDVHKDGIDLLSLTAHKMYGPKGAGALFVRKRLEIGALVTGGGHEHGLRAGTMNVPGIVGLGRACVICREEMPAEASRVGRLRDRLLAGLRARLDGLTVNGSLEHRLPNNLHVSFDGVDGESLLVGISDIAVSSSSACTSASGTPSHVLSAIMHSDPVPSASIRFGLGRFNTDDDIEYAIEKFVAVVRHLRSMAPV